MEKGEMLIKAAAVGIAGLLAAVQGWFGIILEIWAICMLFDWISGSLVGSKSGSWSSERAREGIWHKGGMILIVLCAAGADIVLGLLVNNIPAVELPFVYSVLICPLVTCWYIVTELGSIVENAIGLGAPCPSFLQKILKIMNSSISKAGDKIADIADEDKPE